MVEAVEEVLDPFLKISCLLLIFYCGNSIHSCGRVAGSMPYREGRRSLQTSLAAPNSKWGASDMNSRVVGLAAGSK